MYFQKSIKKKFLNESISKETEDKFFNHHGVFAIHKLKRLIESESDDTKDYLSHLCKSISIDIDLPKGVSFITKDHIIVKLMIYTIVLGIDDDISMSEIKNNIEGLHKRIESIISEYGFGFKIISNIPKWIDLADTDTLAHGGEFRSDNGKKGYRSEINYEITFSDYQIFDNLPD